jgi:hypothetical protein
MGNNSSRTERIRAKFHKLYEVVDLIFFDDVNKKEILLQYETICKKINIENIRSHWVDKLLSQMIEYHDVTLHMFMLESFVYISNSNILNDSTFLENLEPKHDLPILPKYYYFQCSDANIPNIITSHFYVSLINGSNSRNACVIEEDKRKNQILYPIGNIHAIYLGFLQEKMYPQEILILPTIRFIQEQYNNKLYVMFNNLKGKENAFYSMITEEKYIKIISQKLKFLSKTIQIMYLETPNNYIQTIKICNDILLEIQSFQSNLTPDQIAMFISQITQYRKPNTVIFMLLSLLFIAKHPEYVQVILDYTGSFYTLVNPFLDKYLNPNDPQYLKDEHLLKDDKLETLQLLKMFKDPDFPSLPKDKFFRCVLANDKMDFSATDFINYRITSTSLYAPNEDLLHRDNCPSGEDSKRLDQVLFNEDGSVFGLFIGFLSLYPEEHEVLIGPGTHFHMTKSIDTKQFYTISQNT